MADMSVIEDMARVMCDSCPILRKCETVQDCCVARFAKQLYLAGYRKQDEIVRCKDCEYLMFSDCYGECRAGRLGIVSPNDYCSRGVLKKLK